MSSRKHPEIWKKITGTSVALLSVLSVLFVSFAAAVAQQPTPKLSKSEERENAKFRLPAIASPSQYDLSFEPDMHDFTFSGRESVLIQLTEATDKIVMNALELTLSEATISPTGLPLTTNDNLITQDPAEQSLATKFDTAGEKVTFTAGKSLPAGAYRLSCKFRGKLNEQLRGFYRAGYEDELHHKHWLAATQMEPTDARRVFPCFDEPAYKAVFDIKVTIDSGLVAISNAPVLKEEPAGNHKKTVTFEPSPKMSSYLVSLTCGDLKCSGETRSTTMPPVPIKVWAVAGKEQLGHYALSEAAKILDFETSYFGLPYLGKKLDLIALPEFSFGGMENVGAITFNDTSFLIDDKTGSSFDRQQIFGVMAHEVAHQWFGDLVTMKWWDDLWLNESFATWMSTKVEDALHPEWRSMAETVHSRNYAMSTDALKSTRTIHAAVTNPAQAVEMIDVITYSKGAAVLRMLETFVGNDIFQRGISKYLHEHQFGNASGEDFWGTIGGVASTVPVPAIVRSFVLQPGYPQVNAVFSSNGHEIALSQYRQLKLGQDKKDPSLWLVPLRLRQLDGPAPKESSSANSVAELLSKREQQIKVDKLGLSNKPVFINAGGMGYYKTCYDHKHLQTLQAAFAQLRAEEKLVLLNDCSSLVLPGDIAVEDDYNFIHKIKQKLIQ